MRTRAWLVCCVAAFCLLASEVRAQESVSASPNPVLLEAVAAYEAGDLELARGLFEQVHSDVPTARTLRSLGLVAFRQERFVEAVARFEASLVSDVKPLSEQMREDVAGLLAEARDKLEHQHAAASPRPEPVASSASEPLAVRNATEPAPLPPAPLHSPGRSRRLKRAGYALLGVAAASLVGAGTAYLIGRQRLQNIEEHCRAQPSTRCTPSDTLAREHAARLDMLSKLSMAGVILGGASAAGAATLLTFHYLPSSDGDRHQSVFVFAAQATF